jgi:hypothetical protein
MQGQQAFVARADSIGSLHDWTGSAGQPEVLSIEKDYDGRWIISITKGI